MYDTKLSGAKKVHQLREMARQFGLQPRQDPEPLPAVDIEDVQLVTWMSIIPEQAEEPA